MAEVVAIKQESPAAASRRYAQQAQHMAQAAEDEVLESLENSLELTSQLAELELAHAGTREIASRLAKVLEQNILTFKAIRVRR
jgi:hypothetical protein